MLAVVGSLPFLIWGAANVPYWDDWEVCRPLLGAIGWWRWIAEPHIDHVMPVPRLLLALSAKAGLLSPRLEQWVGALCLVAATSRLARDLASSAGIVEACVVAVALGATSAWENMTMGWQFHLLLAFALSTAALRTVFERPLLATALSWVASFCYAGSLAALPVVLLASVRVKTSLRRRLVMAAIWVFGIIGFLLLRQLPSEIDATIEGLRPESGARHEPALWLLHAVQLVGAAFVPVKSSPAACLAVGLAVLTTAIVTCVQRRSAVGSLMILTVVGYSLAVAWGRFQWGEALLDVSRYFTFPRLLAYPIALATRVTRANAALSALLVVLVGISWVSVFPLARQRSVENDQAYCCARAEASRRVEHLAEIAPNAERATACLDSQPAIFPTCDANACSAP